MTKGFCLDAIASCNDVVVEAMSDQTLYYLMVQDGDPAGRQASSVAEIVAEEAGDDDNEGHLPKGLCLDAIARCDDVAVEAMSDQTLKYATAQDQDAAGRKPSGIIEIAAEIEEKDDEGYLPKGLCLDATERCDGVAVKEIAK